MSAERAWRLHELAGRAKVSAHLGLHALHDVAHDNPDVRAEALRLDEVAERISERAKARFIEWRRLNKRACECKAKRLAACLDEFKNILFLHGPLPMDGAILQRLALDGLRGALMSNETKPAAPGIPPELLPMISAMSGMLSAMELGRAHATFAASALQGLIIANVQPGAMLNGSQLVADAWRFADAMMQELHARAAQGAGASSLASVLAQGSA